MLRKRTELGEWLHRCYTKLRGEKSSKNKLAIASYIGQKIRRSSLAITPVSTDSVN